MLNTDSIKLLSFVVLLSIISINTQANSTISEGEKLYRKYCFICHAMGNGGLGLPLESMEYKYLKSSDFLKKTIKHGRPGRIMPGFNDLNEQQLDQIIEYIFSLAPDEIPPAGKHRNLSSLCPW